MSPETLPRLRGDAWKHAAELRLPHDFARACMVAARVYRDAAEHAAPDEVNAWHEAAQSAEQAASLYQALRSAAKRQATEQAAALQQIARNTVRRRCIEQLREAGLTAFANALETGEYARHFGLL